MDVEAARRKRQACDALDLPRNWSHRKCSPVSILLSQAVQTEPGGTAVLLEGCGYDSSSADRTWRVQSTQSGSEENQKDVMPMRRWRCGAAFDACSARPACGCCGCDGLVALATARAALGCAASRNGGAGACSRCRYYGALGRSPTASRARETDLRLRKGRRHGAWRAGGVLSFRLLFTAANDARCEAALRRPYMVTGSRPSSHRAARSAERGSALVGNRERLCAARVCAPRPSAR